nr:family 78 glycoside hydrolase catalytic domain [uncultured Brevundimonas sp.]
MRVDRRTVLKSGLLSAGVSSVATPHAQAETATTGRPTVSGLKVCGLENPLSLARSPRLAWSIGAPQAAYRITCAASERDLQRGRNLSWDSGRVESAAHFDIAYEGPAIAPRQRVWWRVQTWTAQSASATSRPAFWEAAITPEDWSAEWLASEHPEAKADRLAGLYWITGTGAQRAGVVRAFRTVIDGSGAASAELLLSANTLQGIWLNDAPLQADGPEEQSWTTMAVYPLALKPGPNVLAFALTREAGFGVPAAAAAGMVRLTSPSGQVRRITTQSGWRTQLTPPDGWRQAAFDDSAWPEATPPTRLPAGEPWLPYPAMHLRKAFTARRRIRSARLHATALGCYEAWINGHRVGDRMMAPEMTDPARRILFQTYDVTALMRQGDNAVGLWVGDGWYGSEYSGISRFTFGPAPCRVRAQLDIEYDDGSRETVATGPGWKTKPSPVLSSEIYDGEVYDARAEVEGWSQARFDDAAWAAAEPAETPTAAVEAEDAPPIRVVQTLKAAKITQVKPDAWVLDFGQNFAGWPLLKVRGQAGDRIEMRFAEVLLSSGEVDQSNLRSALARDTYVLKGRGEETWSPRFTYHGFRYVQISGLRTPPTAETLKALVGHNDLTMTGLLRLGDPVIETFWRNAVWSQRSNFFGLPTDCPQRNERLGWMGDAEVFWPAAAYNMDVQAYSSRVMGDVRHGQSAKGGFPDVIPPFFVGLELTSPGWSDAGVVLPHTAWMRSGDTGIVRENWEAMERHMAYILSQNPNHLWAKARGADYGDWLAVDAKEPGDATTPKDLVGTAYWARCAGMMAEMAQAIGRADDAVRYRALFDQIRAAFNTAYVKADGEIGNGSQTSYILPIAFGLLDDGAKAEAGRRLAADIHRRSDTLSTGFLGTPHILDALAISGHAEVAVTLLLQRAYPSWGYMVEKGATTMWERWNSDTGDVAMNSYNHYAFGAIVDFLFRRIAGVAPAAPGFDQVVIDPIVDQRLGHAGADYISSAGRIRVDWRFDNGAPVLNIDVPPGAQAEVRASTGVDWRLGDQRARQAPIRLTSGRHRLTANA